ncbi:MAG TPA: molybdopterin cofactor-binding domain-containing protein, partial [Azospirillaceae bacterium]|nr:molybdopterin cofactor-binding domain-containing protein [Azospirillaceae bacterium]
GQFDVLRTVGAAAREMLIAAAAEGWGVPRPECAARDGRILHAVSGRSAGYGDLAERAARQKPPASPPLKPRGEWRLIGKGLPRLDIPAKVDGSAVYGIDVALPGLLTATIVQCPTPGGRLASVDEAPALAVRGVRKVVRLDNAVAVVADGWWAAKKGLEALAPTWDPGPNPRLSSADFSRMLHAGAQAGGTLYTAPGSDAGKVDAEFRGALGTAAASHEAVFEVPFLAHATMEPMNATARVTGAGAELWVPTQSQSYTRTVVARALDLPEDKVVVHTTFCGGGFGRRSEADFVLQAVQVAKQAGTAVKLVWSREEDMRHDYYRPAVAARFRAGLDAKGMPVALAFDTACPSLFDYSRPGLMKPVPFDGSAAQGVANSPYAFGARRVSWTKVDAHLPVGFWRSVGASQNVFFLECFIDELAHRAGIDPVAYRRTLLAHEPRHLRVLDAATAGWGRPAEGRAQGVAFFTGNGTSAAQVAEVSVASDRTVRVHRITCAFDCGVAVNPNSVRAQIEGGIVWGLSSLMQAVTIRDGAVEQGNFDGFPLLSLAQTPEIEIILLESEKIAGAGEEAVPLVVPAVVNAVSAATGERIRSMPLSAHGFQLG